jgi:hypothetical protein
MTQKLIDLMADKADSARFAGLSLCEMREVIRSVNAELDIAKIQEAIEKIIQGNHKC